MKISISPSNEFYFLWNEKKIIFIRNSCNLNSAFQEFEGAYAKKLSKNESWKIAALPLNIQNESAAVIQEFSRIIFKKCDGFDFRFGEISFDACRGIDKRILADIVFCVNDNYEDGLIVFNDHQDKHLSSISVFDLEATWKSEFSKNKHHKKTGKVLMSLPLLSIKSYLADCDGVTFKLQDGSFVNLGYGDYSLVFDEYIAKCSSPQ